jgi:hypothetical protein
MDLLLRWQSKLEPCKPLCCRLDCLSAAMTCDWCPDNLFIVGCLSGDARHDLLKAAASTSTLLALRRAMLGCTDDYTAPGCLAACARKTTLDCSNRRLVSQTCPRALHIPPRSQLRHAKRLVLPEPLRFDVEERISQPMCGTRQDPPRFASIGSPHFLQAVHGHLSLYPSVPAPSGYRRPGNRPPCEAPFTYPPKRPERRAAFWLRAALVRLPA